MTRKSIILLIALTSFIKKLTCNFDEDEEHKKQRLNVIDEGTLLAIGFTSTIFSLFETCYKSPMPDQNYAMENLQKFVFTPAKTTVGFGSKFTVNRKFFANLIQTTAFKEMVANDKKELRRNIINKMKYCDQAIMDQEILKDFYDREVDQSKI